MRGVGDTFDVSWSSDGQMLCSCFSSGTINIMLLGADESTPENQSDEMQ